jgi:hypothetical protein
MANGRAKVIQNSAATFKRVIGNTAISLQPMLGTWIIFDNDRFDLDGAVKVKTAGGFGSGMILKQLKEREFYKKWNRQL